MKNEKRKFFLMLFFAFLLLVAVFFAHAWYTKKGLKRKKQQSPFAATGQNLIIKK